MIFKVLAMQHSPIGSYQDFQNSPGALAAAGGCTTGALEEDFGAADACAGVGLITTGVSSSS